MAKIVFPNITITPSNSTLGVATSVKPRVRIPHIVGTGTNGVTSGKIAKPVVTGANSIATSAGSLSGLVYRFREAVDIAGNNAPSATHIPCVVSDVTPTNIYPVPQYSDVQFDPTVARVNSQFYEFEIEDELEFVEYDAPVGAGDAS